MKIIRKILSVIEMNILYEYRKIKFQIYFMDLYIFLYYN